MSYSSTPRCRIPQSRPKPIGRPRKHHSRSATATREQQAQQNLRVQDILSREIDFVPNRCFSGAGASRTILRDLEGEGPFARRAGVPPEGTSAYFASLYATPLLTAEQEAHLFRQFNYLKFCANQRRSQFEAQQNCLGCVEEIEMLLERAAAVRNRLIQANLRLVVSIARRLTDRYNTFEELVSDGNVSLMRAAEKFNYARGFRFSTYATHVIQRELYRQSRRRRDEARRLEMGSPLWLTDAPERTTADAHSRATFDKWQRLLELMKGELDEREQFVLSLRIGLDLERGPQTLQKIGKQLGISKERVRQLEGRAIARLQVAARKDDICVAGRTSP